MKLSEISKGSIAKASDEELLAVHRRLHQLSAGSACARAKMKHDEIVAPEMLKREFEHKSPLVCEKAKGLYLVPPHGELIATGRKTAVAKSREFGLEGDWVLVSGKQAWGNLALGEPEEVSLAEFDSRFPEHQVSVKARLRWWPDAESLWLYGVERFEAYLEPRRVEVRAGVQMKMGALKFEDEKSRATSTLQKLSALPSQFVWIPDFVSLTGSQLYAKEGHEPRDVDVVLRAEPDVDGFELSVPLDASFALKLERLLKDKLDSDAVQYIGSPTGPVFDYAPLYDLCLVRRPKLEVVSVAEREPEFAEQQYKARQTLSASALERLLRGASSAIRKQAARSYSEDEIVPGRAFVPLKPLRAAAEGERQTIGKFYEFIVGQDTWPWYVSAKRDGVRHTIHRRDGKVLILSDDGADNTAKLPELTERLEKFGEGDFILDAEIELWRDGQHFPREAAAGVVHSGEGTADLVANVFWLLYWDGEDLHARPFAEVWALMQELPVDTKSDGKLYPRKGPLNLIPHYEVASLDALKTSAEKTAYRPGVEGVVVKRADGTYPLDGEPGSLPSSVKWHKNVSFTATVLDRIETKTPGVYNYVYGIPQQEERDGKRGASHNVQRFQP